MWTIQSVRSTLLSSLCTIGRLKIVEAQVFGFKMWCFLFFCFQFIAYFFIKIVTGQVSEMEDIREDDESSDDETYKNGKVVEDSVANG